MSLSPSARVFELEFASVAFTAETKVKGLPVVPEMDLPSIRRAIRLEKDREKKSKRRKVTALEVSQWCLTTALCIAVGMQGDFTAAADWLACPHRRGKPLDDTIDHETVKVELKKLYDAKAPHELAQWADPVASPLPRSCLKTALKWCYEYKLKQLVRSANVDAGAPVRSVRLVGHYNSLLESPTETCYSFSHLSRICLFLLVSPRVAFF